MHMIHDKIYEKHKLINKLRITSIHDEICEQAHLPKSMNEIPTTWIHVIQIQICAQTNKSIRFLSKIYFCTQWHINSAKLLLWLCVLFYSSFVYTCVCVFLHIQSPLRECRSTWSGASGLPYYCAPLLCISVVIELLAVWRHNKPKTKNQKPITHSQDPCMQSHFTSTSSPPTPLHLIAISVLAINSLSRACRWASPQQPLRIKKKG